MEDPQKSEAFYKMIQNLAILSKPQNLNLSSHKLDLDLEEFESPDLPPTRSNSESGFLKRSLSKEKSVKNTPKSKKSSESSKVKLKASQRDEDSDSNSNHSRKWFNSQTSFLSTQLYPADLEVDNFRTKPQSNKFHYMTIDTEDLHTKGSPKAKRNSSNTPLSEKERLIELIHLAAEENFELRKSNVKFQQQRRLQILKVRDLKFKISQQNQKISQQKAEERAIMNLKNVIDAKESEVRSLRCQIELLSGKLLEKFIAEAELRSKKPVAKSGKREHRRAKSRALARDHAKHIGDIDEVQTLASKLNRFLAQVSQLKENTVNQLQFFQQQHG